MRIVRFVILVLFVICCLGFVNSAFASYISLNTALSSKVKGNNLLVSVSVINKGDESAYNVQAELKLDRRQALGEKVDQLPVNGNYSAQFTLPLSYAAAGSYPLALIMHYTDANQYPFSALSCQTFAYKKEAAPEIFGQLKPTQFAGEGTVRLVLKNLGDKEIRAVARLVLSRELTAKDETAAVVLGPRSEKSSPSASAIFPPFPAAPTRPSPSPNTMMAASTSPSSRPARSRSWKKAFSRITSSIFTRSSPSCWSCSSLTSSRNK